MRKRRLDIRLRDKLKFLKEICRLKNSLEIQESGVEYSGSCCNKATFDSESEALASIRGHRSNSTRPIRAYLCEAGKWHLTSMPKRTFDKFNNKKACGNQK